MSVTEEPVVVRLLRARFRRERGCFTLAVALRMAGGKGPHTLPYGRGSVGGACPTEHHHNPNRQDATIVGKLSCVFRR